MRSRLSVLYVGLAALVLVLMASASPRVQSLFTPVQIVESGTMVPISSTGAVNAQTTLTIPAPPPGQYNYVCSIHLNLSQDGTGTAVTNGVTTSTNFNSFALKFSDPLLINGNRDIIENWGIANVGCPKSTSPGTATTFVSPAAVLHTAFTWTVTYYQK